MENISRRLEKRGRVFERVRAVCVEETPTICPEHLDRLLRSNRTLRDGLRRYRLSRLPAIGVRRTSPIKG